MEPRGRRERRKTTTTGREQIETTAHLQNQKKINPLSNSSDDDDDRGRGLLLRRRRRGFFLVQLGPRPQARGPAERVAQGSPRQREARAALLVPEPGEREERGREERVFPSFFSFLSRERGSTREREARDPSFFHPFSLQPTFFPNPFPPRTHTHTRKKKTEKKNQIYAIEARSPAEGAYSEGFADAKLTQDFCIECPTTKTLFSLKTGEIVAWYPTNPILRALTPRDTCRPLDIFPVRVTQEAISVDAATSSGSGSGSAVPSTRGGADSSIDRNNVYAISPKTYTSDDDFYAPSKASGGASSSSGGGADIGATAATITSVVAVVATGAAGTAVAIYKDLGVAAILAVWVAVGAATFAYSRSGKE